MLSRVKKDLVEAISNPIIGVSIMLSGEEFSEWIIRLTPYNDVLPLELSAIGNNEISHTSELEVRLMNEDPPLPLFVKIKFGNKYPFQPPELSALSYIPHIAVLPDLSICLEMLRFHGGKKRYDGWSPSMSAYSILLQLQGFLDCPHIPADTREAHMTRFLSEAKNAYVNLQSKGLFSMLPRTLLFEISVGKHSEWKNTKQIAEKIKAEAIDVKAFEKKKKAPIVGKKSELRRSSSYYSCLIENDNDSNELADEVLSADARSVTKSDEKTNLPEPEETVVLTSEAAVWKNHLLSLIPPSTVVQSDVSAPPGDISYGALTNKSIRDSYTYAITSDEVKAAGSVGKLPSLTLLNLLQYNTPKEIASIAVACKLIYKISGEGLLWRSLLARYYPDCRAVPRLLGGSWRDVWLLEANNIRFQELCCFVSKSSFHQDVLGIPLDWTINPKTGKIDYIHSTMELMSLSAFQIGVRKTTWGETIQGWLPIFLTSQHFASARVSVEESLTRLAPLVGLAGSHCFNPLTVLEVLPRLMKTMIVLLVDNGIDDVDSALRGYCMIHRLFIALVQHYPQLQTEIFKRLQLFLTQPSKRNKKECPDLGNLMPLLSVCDRLGWMDLSPALLGESFARQVLWSCRDIPELAHIRRDQQQRGSVDVDQRKRDLLQRLLESSAMRRRLFSFHCCFLRLTSGPHGCNLDATSAMYDRTLGIPSKHMVSSLRKLLVACQAVTTWPGFFRSVCLTPLTPLQLFNLWADSVQTSLRCRYHTARTDFSRIQCNGVSKFLLRGETFSRIVFCIDISGSMSINIPTEGNDYQTRIGVVTQKIEDILSNQLNHRQQFSILRFNHAVLPWGSGVLQQATAANIKAGVQFVRSRAFEPQGGTNIMDALRTAFRISGIEAVYLISDGEDSEVSLEEVRRLSDEGRIQCHTTAFCSSLEGSKLLESIATATNGSFAYFDKEPTEGDVDSVL